MIESDPISLLLAGTEMLGISLREEQIAMFKTYLIEINQWNKKINLISRKSDQEIVLKDFLDSLTIFKYLSPKSQILDLGSGAGFPGIPLKIVIPEIRLFLLEATLKKIVFLKYLVHILKLRDVEIRWTGESKKSCLQGRFDFVVSRAFGSLNKIAYFGLPLLKPGGIVLAMKGSRGRKDLERELPTLQKKNLEVAYSEILLLPFLAHERFLVGLRKAS